MLSTVAQVFFFLQDELRQGQIISNLHSSFFLPLKYQIVHCVANCGQQGNRQNTWELTVMYTKRKCWWVSLVQWQEQAWWALWVYTAYVPLEWGRMLRWEYNQFKWWDAFRIFLGQIPSLRWCFGLPEIFSWMQMRKTKTCGSSGLLVCIPEVAFFRVHFKLAEQYRFKLPLTWCLVSNAVIWDFDDLQFFFLLTGLQFQSSSVFLLHKVW